MKINFAEVPDPGDRYELGHILGCGVYGRVHLATDSQASKKRVAIKIQKYNSETERYVEQEYNILRDINNHLNLVDFYGVYKKGNDIWFVLELCEGGPAICLVNGLLAKNRRMAEEHIAYILKEVTKAIIYLHENNVIHRDVKGSNILLTREGEVKLCDFGLSQKLRSSDEKLFAKMGSPCWMAPELAAANQKKKDAYYDNRIDVWALGITAIELGESKTPFQDVHPTRALFQIITNPPPTLQKLSNWSEYYHDFISECLVKCFEYRPYIIEVIDHPFLQQIPENNYHLSLEIKTLLSDIDKLDLLRRPAEIIVNENCVKKGIDGDLEDMYEEDLASLPNLTENSILTLLEKRLEIGECYSSIGDVLLYLNPNERRSIYGKEFHEKYYFKSRSENAPHIYSVGDTAYQNALHHVIPQQVIFIGESASGKTTNYLHLLDHLLYLGENASINSDRIKSAVKLIHTLIHASTPTNDYSTRAIFKTSFSYGKTGKFTGAEFKVLGLEKWRISSPDTTQSNFHFFYYILDGLILANLAEKYKLNTNRDYRYLKREEIDKTTLPKYDTEGNIIKFQKIVQYLEELQFTDDEMSTIYSVIAAILNLGEVQFYENEEGFAEIDNKEPIHNFSHLLEVDNKKICWALTNYCLIVAGKAIRKKNTCGEASDTRDVLANNLYTRLVDYIVSIVNRKLSLGKEIFGEKYHIKILDYFGFECFKQNHLSQFFVNCFNEQIHYHFLQRVFSWEIMDLINEEVKYTPINYFNNKDTLNELLGKPEGVLSIIDDASRKGYSGSYITGNIQNLEKTKIMVYDTLKFSVTHYTGTVSYNVKDMPEKNRDFLPPEIIDTMRNSQNCAISMFFTNKLEKCGNLYIPMEKAKKIKYAFTEKLSSKNHFSQIKKMRTQATIFRAICLDLFKELSIGSGSGGTHFVECIRTDLNRRPLTLQKELLRQQLRALTLIETAKMRQLGYPHRISFSEFLRRYKFLAFDFEENVELTRDNCRLLMVRLKMEGWALGKTKIFLKYYNEEYLSRLYETQVKKIIKIQSILRRFLAKCRLAKEIKDQERECIQEIKKRRRSSIMTEEEAAEIIQKAYRKSTRRKELSDMFEPLEEEEFIFIKPFALKWKNKSIFSVLVRYRAIRLQDLFNFCQQIHLYNLNVYHNCRQIMENVDLNTVDRKAAVSFWLGENIKPVLKIAFRLNDIPFYDTSHMYDLLTNLGNFEKQEPWDVSYQWRESQSQEILQKNRLQQNFSKSEDLVNVAYSRNPDDEIVKLSSSNDDDDEETEDNSKQLKDIQNESVKGNQTPESTDLKSDDENIDENIETDDSVDTDVNISNEVIVGKREREIKDVGVEKQTALNNGNVEIFDTESNRLIFREIDKSDEAKYIENSKPANKDFEYIKPTPNKDENIEGRDNKSGKPIFEEIKLRKVNKCDEVKYIINSRPANKDFDYIKPTPTSIKSKLPVDPIAELRNIVRKDSNVSDDDPPFNFQGMLRKTNFRRDSLKNNAEVSRRDSLRKIVDSPRRDSLKNAMKAVRRFSLGKEPENYADVTTNGTDVEEPITCKPVELEILPGLFINGMEVDL
ncbi:neither inactivation nor afterpotential protein C [Anoplophora glabripennis]|uniref:neither inactivation nor afterpotential protein C n=1 Tax=Anoplophora glabripennis TaxID=217634 RepID=UPI0008742E35|nr:neither inactivation nor afterpotential protein C [Anoplophora glabripennis]